MSYSERRAMWSDRIQSFKASGEKSIAAWCRQNHVNVNSMYSWLKKYLQTKNSVEPKSTSWVKLMIIYDQMREELLKEDRFHADETTLQVLQEPGRRAGSKSYLWQYRTGRDLTPIVLFDYQQTRASKHPKSFLKEFKVMRDWEAHLEWEEANWHNVIAREEKEESMSQEEINWLNNWLSEEQ